MSLPPASPQVCPRVLVRGGRRGGESTRRERFPLQPQCFSRKQASHCLKPYSCLRFEAALSGNARELDVLTSTSRRNCFLCGLGRATPAPSPGARSPSAAARGCEEPALTEAHAESSKTASV